MHVYYIKTSNYFLIFFLSSKYFLPKTSILIIFFLLRFFGSRYSPPREIPPERFTSVYSPKECSLPMLFLFVARFARVRIEDSSRNRFVSTAYFVQSQTMLFPCILFMGGMFRGGNNRGGTFRGEFSGRNIPVTVFSRYNIFTIVNSKKKKI